MELLGLWPSKWLLPTSLNIPYVTATVAAYASQSDLCKHSPSGQAIQLNLPFVVSQTWKCEQGSLKQAWVTLSSLLLELCGEGGEKNKYLRIICTVQK